LQSWIVTFYNREAARNRENAAEILHKWKKTAQDAIDKGRQLTAGLYAAAGKFTLGKKALQT
jgi:hypothetical protein